MQNQESKLITIRIPKNIDEKDVREGVERMMEDRYGYVKIDKIRKRLGIKRLKKKIYKMGDENVLKKLRDKARARAQIA